MKNMLLIATLLGCAGWVQAQTPPAVKAEIGYLLEAVEKSQCKFNRNGSWHDAKSARKHLQTKFEYLDKKNMLATAESFIELGAARSSSSGKAYQMVCPGGQPMASTAWLTAELARLRATKP